MEKRALSKYLIDKREQIRKFEVLPRDIEVPATKRFVIPLIGPRRAGKSYYLYDLILNKLKIKDEDFIYLNFEDAETIDSDASDVMDAVNLHEELYGKKLEYIFLDEVQNVINWQRVVRGLFETKNHYIFITGSSSKLLSKEIATALRGRTLTYSILPLSFREYLEFNRFEIKPFYSTSEENRIKNHLRKYMEFGGFPDIVFENQMADRFFKEYLDLVIFKDVIERYRIKNIFIIKFLIKTMIASFSKQFSVHSAFNTLKSQGIKASKKTLYNYSSYLEDSFFVFFLKKFSYSVKETELSIPKIYINDTGLLNSTGLRFSENIGRLMENVVYLELKRAQNENPKLELYYFKDVVEVDFLLKEGAEIKQLVQVSYDISDPDTRKRELKAMLRAGEELDCRNLFVITWDLEGEEDIKNQKVIYIPLWKWLLETSEKLKAQ